MVKTIRVIDLLNKIANGEDVPELIEYNGENYIFQNKDYKNEDRDLYLFSEETPDITAILNDEVKIIEIIEEQQEIDIQEIEEIEIIGTLKSVSKNVSREENLRRIDKTEVNNFYKINDIIKQQNKILQWAKQLDKNIKDKE